MNFLKKLQEKRKTEFMKHVRSWVIERVEKGHPMTDSEYSLLRINSYEQRLLQELLDDDAFLKCMEYSLNQIGKHKLGKYEIAKSYNDAIWRFYVPELIKRFKESKRKNDEKI